jgi:hypothetical protein
MHTNTEPSFLWEGKRYQGNYDEVTKEWIECTENLANPQSWEEFIEDLIILD